MKEITNSVFTVLQRLAKSLMVPVSVLPAAGLLVALGRVLQDSATTEGVVTSVALMSIGKLFYSGGLAIFEQLPLVFAIGVAIGFTGGAGVAGLASAVGYFTLINVLKVIGEVQNLELAINTGVFGGIIIGLLSAYLYNKFYQTTLPRFLGFFAGKRLVPILTAATAVIAGIVLGYIWPPIQQVIHDFGVRVMASEYGPAFYAAGKRLLIPVGLHHVYYPPFLYEFGSFVTEAGKTIHGESVRYFAGDPTAGKIMASEFPIMLFGLPAAALAMTLRAPKAKRTAIGGIMFTAALTSILTGITEPLEFAFIFVAPLLYGFHVCGAFISGLLTNHFDIHLGYTFSASLIDFVVGYFNQQNSFYLWLVVGPIIAVLYFGVFYTLIPIFDFKTPGREDEDLVEVDANISATDKAIEILAAIGGASNIKNLDACITRLRLVAVNPDMVSEEALKKTGSRGIMKSGNNVQIIYGTESEQLKEEILSLAKAAPVIEKVHTNGIYSPLKGQFISIADVPDPTFSGKLVGDGFAIDPTEGVVYSPVDGKVAQIFHTNHAVGIIAESGAEVLVHVGIDTVKMKGEGFTGKVAAGDSVKKGDILIEFDLDLVKERAKSTITPVVITNMDKISDLTFLKSGAVSNTDEILNLNFKQ